MKANARSSVILEEVPQPKQIRQTGFTKISSVICCYLTTTNYQQNIRGKKVKIGQVAVQPVVFLQKILMMMTVTATATT